MIDATLDATDLQTADGGFAVDLHGEEHLADRYMFLKDYDLLDIDHGHFWHKLSWHGIHVEFPALSTTMRRTRMNGRFVISCSHCRLRSLKARTSGYRAFKRPRSIAETTTFAWYGMMRCSATSIAITSAVPRASERSRGVSTQVERPRFKLRA